MNTPITRRAALLAAASLTSLSAVAQRPAGGQEVLNWPTKPLRLVIGFGGGSVPDLISRTIMDALRHELGQPVIVEARPGAGGNIGANVVATATDQHTIGIMSSGSLALARLLNPATPFDPLKDFTPLTLIGTSPLVLVAPAGQGIPVGREFFEAGRQAGGKWSYGSSGVGTIGHISMELLKSRTRIEAVHVPFAGNPQVVSAMAGGLVQMSLMPPGPAAAQIQAGKIIAIGVTSAGRSPLAPELPSLQELGVPNYNVEVWMGAAVPTSMPKPIVNKLASVISEIVRRPEIREKLFQQGWRVEGTAPEGLTNRIKADVSSLGSVIASLQIKPQ